MPMPVMMNLDELVNLDDASLDLANLDDANLDLENLRFSFKKIGRGIKRGFTGATSAASGALNTASGVAKTGTQLMSQGQQVMGQGRQMARMAGYQNLDMQPTTAIVASPEEAMMLLNLNSQLDQPYEIKGAYLI